MRMYIEPIVLILGLYYLVLLCIAGFILFHIAVFTKFLLRTWWKSR